MDNVYVRQDGPAICVMTVPPHSMVVCASSSVRTVVCMQHVVMDFLAKGVYAMRSGGALMVYRHALSALQDAMAPNVMRALIVGIMGRAMMGLMAMGCVYVMRDGMEHCALKSVQHVHMEHAMMAVLGQGSACVKQDGMVTCATNVILHTMDQYVNSPARRVR